MIEIGILGIVGALLWIGWELRKLASLAREFMEGFVEGYMESLKAKGN
jgi:hypothetical protein